ncbi:17128_t:CDS:2 [Cetraspora pellucida]|uniref:17128_t:CDS:1 n=1 Tax=Cetraspora pellucida TaxID=1433469 RepID=A0A9N9IXJ3_9GLOM|nr:17128_t:CDS:2 [Cetraspora pellucida]
MMTFGIKGAVLFSNILKDVLKCILPNQLVAVEGLILEVESRSIGLECLLSLRNTPLIEYTLELLAVAGEQNNKRLYQLNKQVHFTGQSNLCESPIYVLDGKINECVHCETVEVYPRKRRIVMDMEVFKKHADVQIRNDLIDCQIDIVQ